MPDQDAPILPPPEILNDPAVENTSIADLVEKDPFQLTDQEIHTIINRLRKQRENFIALDEAKARGTVSKHARKLPSKVPKVRHSGEKIPIDQLDLDIDIDSLGKS